MSWELSAICIFKHPRLRAFQGHTACRIAAKKSCSSHLFGVVPSRAAQTAFVPELSKAITFFVLSPILVKFHILTHLIESFPPIFRTWWCGEERLHFTPFHPLRQLKRDEGLFPPLWRVVEFRARYRQILVRRFWGGQNLETVSPTVWEL